MEVEDPLAVRGGNRCMPLAELDGLAAAEVDQVDRLHDPGRDLCGVRRRLVWVIGVAASNEEQGIVMWNEGEVLDREAVVDCIVREGARREPRGSRRGCEPYVVPTAGVADPGELAPGGSGHDVGGKRSAEDLLDGKAGRVRC